MEDLSGERLSNPSLLGFLTTDVCASLVAEMRCFSGLFSFVGIGVMCMLIAGDVFGDGLGILEAGSGVWCWF